MLARFVCCLCFLGLVTLTLQAQDEKKGGDPKAGDKKDPAQDPAKGKKGKGPDVNAIYKYGPDCEVQEGVPQGTWDKFVWDKSEVYPKTTRDVWVYVPAQYDPKVPANVAVWFDGVRFYANRKGEQRIPNVIDNLTNRKELPVIVSIFIDPGSFTAGDNFKNRSNEYDALGNKNVTFLEKEILPEVGKKFNLRQDAASRMIGGLSSGGIAAFTAAWERPDLFSKVHTEIGSFTNIKGGHVYPKLIMEAQKKPIRVFLTDGENDNRNAANPERDWHLQNVAMVAAFQAKNYDMHYVFGLGAHSGKQGATLMPEAMRWLWRADIKQ